jgi:hypothetical protein
MTGIDTASADRFGQFQVVTGFGAVAIHAGEQDFPRAAMTSTSLRPGDGLGLWGLCRR